MTLTVSQTMVKVTTTKMASQHCTTPNCENKDLVPKNYINWSI